jgi:hypothetical protein
MGTTSVGFCAHIDGWKSITIERAQTGNEEIYSDISVLLSYLALMYDLFVAMWRWCSCPVKFLIKTQC